LLAGLALAAVPLRAAAPDFAALEKRSGGRLGVCILDTATGARVGYRGGERFPMCSTFKLLAAAATLARVDAGNATLDRQVAITRADFVPANSPLTASHLGGSMPVGALCEAAMIVSDNTAANLLVAALGGPAALTAWLRATGDSVTRLDRVEPAVN
jgi:beta-lactamase class A